MADQRDRPRIPSLQPTSGIEQYAREARGPKQNTAPTLLSAGPMARKDAHFGRRSMSVAAVGPCTALGLASVAVADAAGRHGFGYAEASVFFWAGLLLIFVPIAARVLMQDAHRDERLAFIVLLGVALYLVKILASPDGFTITDEYIHLLNTQNILRTRYLFTFNPLLPTAAYYPGLAAATAGLVSLTGLSPFASGLLIIGAARVLISACVFLVAERLTGSALAAAGASIVYTANPMFLFWSASFSYENLALPLAAFVVWWLSRTRDQTGRLVPVVTVITIVAVVLTHHVVGFALAGLLGVWWLADHLAPKPESQRSVGLMALVAGTTALAWFFLVARPAASYLFTDNILPALQQTSSLLLGNSAPRHLYASGGYTSPKWYTLGGFAAIGLLLLALPPALYLALRMGFWSRGTWRDWHYWGCAPMAVAIGVAITFPLSLMPRLTSGGVAISGRSSEYVFTGLGCVLGLLVEEPARWLRGKSTSQAIRAALGAWLRTLVATVVITVVFIGNITIGTAFYQLLPESSDPQGYPWTVQPDVVSASKWAREHLGINQRFGANSTDALALATYGGQDTIAENSVWPIFFAKVMNETVVHNIKAGGVRYLLVDWRMTMGVPASPGYYFSPQEPNAGEYTEPFPAAGLRKFASAACAHLSYDSGPIQIFDVSRIENGSCVPSSSTGRNESVSP